MLRWLTALVCALALAGAAWAQEPLPVPALSGRVIDQTGTLSGGDVQALTAQLAAVEQAHGAQIVVLMVASTQPEDIAAYAQRVADTWKIGRREVGDGVLVVVAKNDRRVRIEVAKALEGALPDLAASRIIAETITPAFKAGDFAGGLRAGIERLDARIGNEGLPEPDQRRASSGFDWQDLAIFLFVGAPIAGAVLTAVLGRKLGALATGGAIGALGWWLTASLLVAGAAAIIALMLVGVMGVGSRASVGRGGRGGPVIWGGHGGGWGGGRGGGGFGSGGGGDFGGGGASGSW
ncbi:MAG: TPM domain-containing protein [Ideonella sp.]|nr:TPM domain-containing protein [Ideonella sp.]